MEDNSTSVEETLLQGLLLSYILIIVCMTISVCFSSFNARRIELNGI